MKIELFQGDTPLQGYFYTNNMWYKRIGVSVAIPVDIYGVENSIAVDLVPENTVDLIENAVPPVNDGIIVTKTSLAIMIHTASWTKKEAIVGRGIFAIYKNQTEEEKCNSKTKVKNGIGFSSFDVVFGTKVAIYWHENKHLPHSMVAAWCKAKKDGYPRICKYHRQLNLIALKNISGKK